MNKHYDIGVIGWWYNNNHGANFTYYALNKVLKSLGYSVVMLNEALGYEHRIKRSENVPAMVFAKKHYEITEQVNYKELSKLNDICDIFLCGSDQLWNHRIRQVKTDLFLDFVDDNHKKIAYATSFGNREHMPSNDIRKKHSKLLQRFDCISVREDYAPEIAERVYGVKAQHVIDPVFFLEAKDYEELINEASIRIDNDFLLAFILDPTVEKKKVIDNISKKLKLDIVVLSNPDIRSVDRCKEIFNNCKVIDQISPNNFIYAYKNSKYVITDSFHGSCFCYIFRKNFSVFYNHKRGSHRFESLFNLLRLENRRIQTTMSEEDIENDKNIQNQVDFRIAEEQVQTLKQISLDWLRNVLETPKEKLPSVIDPNFNSFEKDSKLKAEIERTNADTQLTKVKILVALLRDYGIRHIVLSPGGRDVPIVKMFEFNEEYFKLYHVTDERSAGYFALGLATKIRAPVAMVCTSGTAASNYLPSITEAFYTHIPIIAITADRYPMFVNQGEDQTIPQVGMYDKVIKKSCTISIGTGPLSEWETRRNISDCILECTRDIPGPVHINVPIHSLWTPTRKEAYELPKKLKHILRVTRSDSEKRWDDWFRELKKSKRILIVYGQNYPVTSEQKKDIERFTEKYNCIIVTDHLSNLKCSYSIHPYNMLRKITQDEFNNLLSPDILITVGGKRVMNDPLTYKVRNGSQVIRHWSVTPNGEIKDFYFRLTSVLECTQSWFFKYFADKAGDIRNDNIYYSEWTSILKRIPPVVIDKYSSRYVLSKFLPIIPPKSFIHLGVGLTFIDSQNYSIGEGVEVFCNMGTNGIDGCTSTFMGQCELASDEELCFLAVGDLSFFYDMNGVWNKNLKKNMRILMMNNSGTDLLRGNNSPAITAAHCTVAEGWVKSLGFTYFSATSKEEFDNILPQFVSREINEPVFFEVFT